MYTTDNLGKNIKCLRKQAKLSQTALGYVVGAKCYRTVRSWEQGKSYPSLKHLLALANFFDVTLEDLLGA